VSRRVEVIQPMRCGMGGSQGMDGVDTRDNSLNNMRNQPVEQVEAQSSIRIVDYDIHPDSGGPGQWRGGVGQAITVEVLCDNGILLARGLDRLRFPAWGVRGGQPGARLSVIRNAGRPDERALGKIHELHVRRGETLTLRMPGGGGFGDPFLRDPARVLGDVRQGFVSAASAERDYGVVISDDSVDHDATRTLRGGRVSSAAEFAFGPERTAWEAVFTDAVMHDINTRLYAMPKPMRQDARQALFEAAVPGVSNPANASLAALLPDTEAARGRLQRSLAGMRGA
jgi:N-methylhydantoinase B